MKIRILLGIALVAALSAGGAVAQAQSNQDVGGWAPKTKTPPPPPAPPSSPPPAPAAGDGPKTISRGANDPAPAPGPVPPPAPAPMPGPGPRAQGGGDFLLASDPDAILQVIRDAGYEAKMSSDDEGNPKIIAQASRSTYWILFLDCGSSAGCLGIEFYVSYDLNQKPSLADMNQFNNDYRYIRAFTNDQGQPRMMMDVLMRDEGLGKDAFLEYLRLWTVIMPSFEDAIGF